jgi:pheromone shutdown protein TraB
VATVVHLTLVGTGHVFRIGEAVEDLILARRPAVVCVELDPVRLAALKERAILSELEERGDPRAAEMRARHDEAVKRLPFLYRFLARLQDRLAGAEGVEAGSEMMAAVRAAERLAVPVATIDVDAQALIRRAWQQMGWGERLRFFWAMMRGGKGEKVESEMQRYQDDPVAYLAEVGKEFPSLKRVLIDDRDAHMARALLALRERGADALRAADGQGGALPGVEGPVERIVAVVGDGHVEGMLTHLRGRFAAEELEVIRVGDLRAGRVPGVPGVLGGELAGDTTSVTLRVDVDSAALPDGPALL